MLACLFTNLFFFNLKYKQNINKSRR